MIAWTIKNFSAQSHILKNFSIKDRQEKVLFDMREVHVTMHQFALFQDPLNIEKAKLSDGEVNLSRHPLTGEYNFQFLADYFEQTEDPNAQPTIFGIKDIDKFQVYEKTLILNKILKKN